MQSGAGSGSNGGDEPMPEARLASSTSSGGMNAIPKETPISPYPTLTYGLQETHTTILPWTGWFGVAKPDKDSPIQVKLRCNAVHDMFDNTMGDNAAAIAKGIYDKPLTAGGAYGASGAKFPATMPNATTTTTERPQWRDFWMQLYEYYTVLGCEWKLTVSNETTVRNNDLAIAIQYDSYTDAEGATGNRMPLTSLAETLAFKGIKWYQADAGSTENQQASASTIVIKDTYTPGKTVKRNIVNDDIVTGKQIGRAHV